MKEEFLEPILRRMRLRQVMPHIPAGATVLDIGCGHSARFLRTISPQIQSGVGIDFKVEPILSGNIKTIQQRLDDRLPFADDSFDVVTMLAVLEHLEQEQQMLKEIYRVLKAPGKLVLTVPSVWAQPVLEFLAYRLRIVSEAEIRDHKRYYNREKLRKALTQEHAFQDFYHHYFQLWMNNFCVAVKRPV